MQTFNMIGLGEDFLLNIQTIIFILYFIPTNDTTLPNETLNFIFIAVLNSNIVLMRDLIHSEGPWS